MQTQDEGRTNDKMFEYIFGPKYIIISPDAVLFQKSKTETWMFGIAFMREKYKICINDKWMKKTTLQSIGAKCVSQYRLSSWWIWSLIW
jgi:hypothetical protein